MSLILENKTGMLTAKTCGYLSSYHKTRRVTYCYLADNSLCIFYQKADYELRPLKAP